ncbi:putative hydrolase YxeP [Gracilariopsis chorda]|uniref:Putative hydrolase YxeP n=1 Tax=Gracilariopsis chorda TaxID=448386 RepID=A0A2V3IU98_9FLOR|nr:putative hydrolase YxeP [Gracilariopsis chorda]|eukprot:PXF45683.1 putative hydrolase YxeP [Gracilariopsis chorda]
MKDIVSLQDGPNDISEELSSFFGNHEALHKGWLRELHSLAEPSFEEYETSKFVISVLERYCPSLDVTTPFPLSPTAVIAYIEPSETLELSKPILLRADMDALRMKGAPTDPPRKNDDYHHGCGHDGHTTCLLAVAHCLHELRHLCKRKVVLFFQPAEESGMPLKGGSGARVALDHGLLETIHPDVSAVYALHCWPPLRVGQVGIGDGPMMGTGTTFSIMIEGTGGHAATPGPDRSEPLLAACSLVCNGQSIVARGLSPFTSSTLAFTAVENVESRSLNVCPRKVSVQGIIRALDAEVKKTVFAQLCQIGKSIAEAYGCQVVISSREGYPATINSRDGASSAKEAARRAGLIVFDVGEGPSMVKPSLCAEDFSMLLIKRPGAYVWLGNGGSAGLHTSSLRFNENAVAKGAKFFAELALGRNCTEQH